MITYINESNIEQYTELFEAAELALGDGSVIQDLPSYFSKLNRLANIAPKFVRLPLDEDLFEIDGDKRLINVPKVFTNNGISVKGDEVAEIVYFRIPRFFDIADLSTKKIVIEWENAAGEKGLTADFMRDIVSEPDMLIFGWPLDSRVTKANGTIKFAIRFYSIDNDGGEEYIDYSLSTLVASAKINATLDIDVQAVPTVDLKNFVLRRLIPVDSPLKAPVITTNLPADAELEEDPDTHIYSKVLSVTPGATPTGNTLTYQWFKDGAKLEGVQSVNNATVNSIGSYYVVLTNTVTIIDSYDASGNPKESHTESSSLKSAVCQIPAPDSIQIIEDMPTSALFNEGVAVINMKIKKPNGTLIAVAKKNKKEDGSGVWENTSKATIASSIDPDDATKMIVTMTVNATSGLYKIDLSNKRNGTETQIVASAACRVTDAAAAPTVEILYNGAAITGNVVLGGTLKANATVAKSDKLEYQWYEKTREEGDDETIKGATNIEYKPTRAGKFYAKVVNKLNGSEASTTSDIVIVIEDR